MMYLLKLVCFILKLKDFVIPVYIFNGRNQTLVDTIGILSALRMRGLHDKRHLLAKLLICGSENSFEIDWFTIGAFTLLTFAIFKIATSWSYHLHLREKSRSFSFTKLHNFLVGSAHVRSQATVHAAHAVCMRPRISIHVSKSARS